MPDGTFGSCARYRWEGVIWPSFGRDLATTWPLLGRATQMAFFEAVQYAGATGGVNWRTRTCVLVYISSHHYISSRHAIGWSTPPP